MLYVLYGLTTEVSRFVRSYFKSLGIEGIEKITYETAEVKIQPSDGRLNRATSEIQVRNCDYVYENHGRIVGFTSAQIENAVTGKADAYLTFSSGELSFLREIKNAYGSHVATIFNFLEDKALERLTNSINAPDSEKLERLAMGKTLKKKFLEERELFDEVVIFTGDNNVFDYKSLKTQYDHIIKKHKELEQEDIKLPYLGSKPYIFVSYARADTDVVVPILEELRKNGCRVWYDKGIIGGDNWLTTLAMKIKGCSQYLLFSSKNSTKSDWTQYEVNYAIKFPRIKKLTVRMDDARFNEGSEMVLENFQNLFLGSKDFNSELLNSILDEVVEGKTTT